MAEIDLSNAIRNMVAVEVEKALEPHRATLERFARIIGLAAPPAPTTARPRGSPPAAARRGPKSDHGASGDAGSFSVGQSVVYKQGRGSFEAKVVSVDRDRNLVKVERIADGKKVDRPAAKLRPA